jgi:hypothetical protein
MARAASQCLVVWPFISTAPRLHVPTQIDRCLMEDFGRTPESAAMLFDHHKALCERICCLRIQIMDACVSDTERESGSVLIAILLRLGKSVTRGYEWRIVQG